MIETIAKGQTFVKRLYLPRIIGLGLGFFCVASVFFQKETPALMWIGLAVNGFLWPHIAYFVAKNSRNPYRAELRNLLIDSFLGGLWVPLMSFNLLPSVVVIVMMSMDNISAGGVRLFIKGAVAQLLGCFLAILFVGLNIQAESTMLNVLACMPMLAAYPLSIGIITYRLAIKLSQQKKEMEKIDVELKETNTNLTAAYEGLRESEKRYRDLSIIDDLTQLYNCRHFFDQLRMEIDRADRYEQPLTMLLLDLDNFKEFNDTYGHVEGNEVLSRLGQAIKKCLRQTDSAYRYGGEEFTILLPMTTSADGAFTAERIRAEFKKEIFSPTPDKDVHMTMSIGIAQHKLQESMETFVHRVDRLMYQAKKYGKDRVYSETT
ncbi:MAG: diguanylate cyclase [Syntrophales bacterium]